MPLHWVAGRDFRSKPEEPVPLALSRAPCFFRTRALDALDGAGQAWRIAITSPSLIGLWSAVDAGLGFTARSYFGLPSGTQLADQELPSLGDIPVVLHRRRNVRNAGVIRLGEITEELVHHYPAQETRQ